ncbi:hypothetical protein LOD50_11235 [Xylella fastidiosa subsp. multiplex]|uniref:Uncharacterized protein n=1 Tax=Xylella fastidiosa subsp. multiplex TaxID=644357 RepID=A0AAW6HWV5_XYLFS|nr:hypothetical protein [Xylella fastidiosa]MDC6408483.1 hypothetical protein [Xylella fastidiosa subsp. multiplex]MDC6408491.1 hypothetical protein [Xylella fastidiosa subsp. multiplex]MDD0936936.1 hypothetical protein [Xylella fastidiosa subsp. multiplex]MSS68329.1 hypothetical protein [Xylella fastidiosa subsp. multiplex]MSS68336.1 hypothetical protein [Xylella fastidiosa subsp. multiplex]
MSELAFLDAYPSFTSSYLNSLNLFVSDLQCCVDSIDKSLLKIFSDASDVSDEIVLEAVESISQSLCEIISELRFLEIRLSRLSSLHSG